MGITLGSRRIRGRISADNLLELEFKCAIRLMAHYFPSTLLYVVTSDQYGMEHLPSRDPGLHESGHYEAAGTMFNAQAGGVVPMDLHLAMTISGDA